MSVGQGRDQTKYDQKSTFGILKVMRANVASKLTFLVKVYWSTIRCWRPSS